MCVFEVIDYVVKSVVHTIKNGYASGIERFFEVLLVFFCVRNLWLLSGFGMEMVLYRSVIK